MSTLKIFLSLLVSTIKPLKDDQIYPLQAYLADTLEKKLEWKPLVVVLLRNDEVINL